MRLKRIASFTVGAVLVLSTFGTVLADGIRVKPWEYDPDRTGAAVAQWVAKLGLPDAGNSNHGLRLEKNAPLTANVAAGAEVAGVAGMQIVAVGYDIRNDSPCGAGAPRFNYQASDGFHFVGGCANDSSPTPVPSSPGWKRVKFEVNNPAEAFPAVTPGATAVSLHIVVDEPGKYVLDNITVYTSTGSFVVGKPGNDK